ncbi:MAG: RAMP superfamily CRISPR-associated protein [Myxococcota bacterium]
MSSSTLSKKQIPQGYEFVQVSPHVACKRRREARLDRRCEGTLSGRLEIRFLTEQPVHVGSGGKRLVNGEVVRSCMRIAGQLGIPGSSLKGLLRARYEALTKSCVSVTKLKAHNKEKIRSTTRVGYAQLLPSAIQGAAFHRCQVDPRAAMMCPACALFGCAGRESQRGRLTCSDLVLEAYAVPSGETTELAELPAQFSPNLHHLGVARKSSPNSDAYFEVSTLHGRKFALSNSTATVSAPAPAPNAKKPKPFKVEVIPKNVWLTGTLIFQNLLPEELGGLLTALGCEPASYLKVGAGRALGFGRVKPELKSIELYDHQRHLVSMERATLRDHFVSWEDRWNEGEKQLITLHQGGC